MKIKVVILVIVLLSFAFCAAAQDAKLTKLQTLDDLAKICHESYEQKAECPKEFCELKCAVTDNVNECRMTCFVKECGQIAADHCPLDSCQRITGCDGALKCFKKSSKQPPLCGGLAYAGGEVECCQGFVKRCGIEYFDGRCNIEGDIPICLPCGNGICNQFENRCNCPEDCE